MSSAELDEDGSGSALEESSSTLNSLDADDAKCNGQADSSTETVHDLNGDMFYQNGGVPPEQPNGDVPPELPDLLASELGNIGLEDPSGVKQQQQQQQYVVYVHVNPGAVFNIKVDGHVQQIRGPAAVRMLSNNGPPRPIPMHATPGHFVQQVVDEHGFLSHVILSPAMGNPAPPPVMQQSSSAVPEHTNGNMHQTHACYMPSHAAGMPSGGIHHSHPIHHHIHDMNAQYPIQMGIPTEPQEHHHHAASTHNDPTDRTARQRNKLREKLNKQQAQRPRPDHQSAELAYSCAAPDESGDAADDVGTAELEALRKLLSSVPPPTVSKVSHRDALIRLSPPEHQQEDFEIDSSDFEYDLQLQLQDKSRAARDFQKVYSGDATEITLKDLRPGADYLIRVVCRLEQQVGSVSESVEFKTEPCVPDQPDPPRAFNSNRTTIQLRWNTVADNGSKLSGYVLEYDQGTGSGSFSEIFNGSQRQFKVTKLQASTGYVFRLAAVNGIGRSQWSAPVKIHTAGYPPSKPDPPMLAGKMIRELDVSWIRRHNDDEFALQMEDPSSGHGFLPQYRGADQSFLVKGLRKNTEYIFRLRTSNANGASEWSDPIRFRTLPDKPSAPTHLNVKGKTHARSLRFAWDKPKDDGGVDIIGYSLELNAGKGYQTVYEGADREYHCDQLVPGSTYNVRVLCTGPGGNSPYSDAVSVTTPAVPPVACSPPRLQGKPRSNVLHLRWNTPDNTGGAAICEYCVLVSQNTSPPVSPTSPGAPVSPPAQAQTPTSPGAPQTPTSPGAPQGHVRSSDAREVYRGRDMDCIVAGLRPGTCYSFFVRAFNKAGASPWSEPSELSTAAGVPEDPAPPMCVCKTPHSVQLSWSVPVDNGAPVTEYRVDMLKGDEYVTVYKGPDLRHEVKSLTPATEYSFRVAASNSAGYGLVSEPSVCTTQASSPGAVSAVRASDVTADSVRISWKKPIDHGAEITAYNVCLLDGQEYSTGAELEYTLEGLHPETNYKVRVQAVNSVGVGTFSSILRFITRPLPPLQPSLECVSVTHNSLKMRWSAQPRSSSQSSQDNRSYTLELVREHGSTQQLYSGPLTTYRVTRLTPQTNYSLRVFATNEAGRGEPSDVINVMTCAAPPPQPKPPRVNEEAPDGSGVCMVEWTGPRSTEPHQYVLHGQVLSGASKQSGYVQLYRGPKTSFRWMGLDAGTKAQVRVCTVRPAADGAELASTFSSPAVFCTSLPHTPAKPSNQASATGENDASQQRKNSENASLRKEQTPQVARKKATSSKMKLSDQHLAVIIMMAFFVLAIIVALAVQQLV